MSTFLAFLMFIAFMAMIVLSVIYIVARLRHKETKIRGMHIAVAGVVTVVLMIGVGVAGSSEESASKPHQSAKQVSESKAKSSSKAESKSEDASIAKVRNKNEHANFDKLQQDISNIPAKTQNAITSATFDKTSNTVELTLTDDALNENDAQLKNLVHTAWTAGNSLVQSDGPYPSSQNAISVSVVDSSGNQLGHSSMFGDFKYDGNK